eukprot:3558544-Karenia_brevis.AAC.1
MGVDGSQPTPPTPLADSHLFKAQQYQELQEDYQRSLAEKGEDHITTQSLAHSIERLAPQTSAVKTITHQKNFNDLLLQGTKALD